MKEEEIIKQIKKSRKQNKQERYDYIGRHFNQTDYAISLEKYILKLLKKNSKQETNWKELKKWLEEMLDNSNDIFSVIRVRDALNKMQELENKNE